GSCSFEGRRSRLESGGRRVEVRREIALTRSMIPHPRAGMRRGGAGRSALIAIAVFVFVGLALHLGKRVIAGNRTAVAEIGAPAPDFELEEVGTGKHIRLSSLRGQ